MPDLTYQTKNGWETMDAAGRQKMMDFSKEYIGFLNRAKTERLACHEAVRLAETHGFAALEKKTELAPGDKVYLVNRDKSVYLAVIGQENIMQGIRFVIAHIDSPRLDLKQNPLYEDSELSLLKTHYYGGIKKYQWTAMPLSLIGVVYKKNGERVDICIGEEAEDPVFCVTDLLPHLADKQMQKKLSEAIEGESLNILVGSEPDGSAEKEKVKHNVLRLLHEKYGMTEEDFLSAELELVPAFPATDVGLDRSMVGGYGQDDRVCAYTALQALLEMKQAPAKTAVCVLVDKEEIGSMGNTGMKSAFFEYATASLAEKLLGNYNELMLKRIFRASQCLSSDVSAAVDPTYQEVNEKNNSAYLGHGIVINKYTGARGKSGTSDANAEFVSCVRGIFDRAGIVWQTAELGKVDAGGGGTIAQYVANLDVDVIDCGVALLSMHAPFEIASKFDIYMAFLTYQAFYLD